MQEQESVKASLQYSSAEHLTQVKLPFKIHPKISMTAMCYRDSSKTKLEMYKEHLENIRLRKRAIPEVPQPSVLECFQTMKQHKCVQKRNVLLKKSNESKRAEYEKLKKAIDKYKEIYESKEESVRQKLLLSKILSTKLENELAKTREKFKDLDFGRVINMGVKKQYFYQLAEVFYNNEARNIFSPESESKTDEEMGVCLGYLGLLIQHVAAIAGVQMWIKFKFKGSKSTITVYDSRVVESNPQGSISQTYVLNPKETRLSVALLSLSEQLRQIMRFNLGMSVSKVSNFYELCEELSKFLLNV